MPIGISTQSASTVYQLNVKGRKKGSWDYPLFKATEIDTVHFSTLDTGHQYLFDVTTAIWDGHC